MVGRGKANPLDEWYIKSLPFTVIEGQEGNLLIEVMYKNEKKQFKPEEILSMPIKKIKERAE